jgi:hypothetical protein
MPFRKQAMAPGIRFSDPENNLFNPLGEVFTGTYESDE